MKTGLRWHLRGYSENHSGFRDFVLSRFSDDTSVDDSRHYQNKSADVAWNTSVTLKLIPNPLFSEAQQQLIATDYSMENSQLHITTKGALVHYLLQEMQIDISQADKAEKQPLVVSNAAEVTKWLFNNVNGSK